jgi:hypothetical protein
MLTYKSIYFGIVRRNIRDAAAIHGQFGSKHAFTGQKNSQLFALSEQGDVARGKIYDRYHEWIDVTLVNL